MLSERQAFCAYPNAQRNLLVSSRIQQLPHKSQCALAAAAASCGVAPLLNQSCFSGQRLQRHRGRARLSHAVKSALRPVSLLAPALKTSCGCDVQEAQKLHAEVVWRIDRLATELADAQRDVAQLSAQARSSGSPRTVGDVDADMEALENQRTGLEREKDTAMRKLERLRYPLLFKLFANKRI